MNYRHIYHAGNFADVFKHAVLVLLLEHLRQKDKPFYVLDTHAGIGRYDLESVEAQKTKEAASGIGRLWNYSQTTASLGPYLDLIRRLNGYRETLRYYPGSPLLIKALLRAGDRLVANELHPEDATTLEKNVGHDERVQIMHADGYLTWKAQMPPAERRGLVLVDPPFEVRDEFDLLLRGMREAYKRWATGIYALWYPIKDSAPIEDFHRALAGFGIPNIIAAHFMMGQANDAQKFNGCGLVIVNPPWKLAEQLQALGNELAQAFTGPGSQPHLKLLTIAKE